MEGPLSARDQEFHDQRHGPPSERPSHRDDQNHGEYDPPRIVSDPNSYQSRSAKDNQAEFCSITGSSLKDAKRYLDKHKRLDVAIDAYFNDGGARRNDSSASTSKLTSLFEKYKDPDSDIISTHGTVRFFSDLGINQDEDQMEDGQDDTPKLLSLAYELRSPRLGEWTMKGWLDGWKGIGCDTLDGMKTALARLEARLGSDPSYFRTVYNYTFTFARSEGQRSLGKDNALEYWKSLLNFGVGKDALKYTPVDEDPDVDMDQGQRQGWTREHTQMWLEYMRARDDIAVSKDTWQMLPDFIRSFDGDFNKHDDQAAWPTIIDQFVEWAKKRV